MKIAVLGCGYVGAEFARQAKAAGHEVLGVVRSEASRDRLRAEGVGAEAFDLQAGDWSALPARFDAVVYDASTGGGGPEAYALAYDVGVKRALAWAAAVGARVYNVGDGHPVTKEALARWIAERLGRSAPVFDPSAPAGPRVAKGGRTQPSRIVATGGSGPSSVGSPFSGIFSPVWPLSWAKSPIGVLRGLTSLATKP